MTDALTATIDDLTEKGVPHEAWRRCVRLECGSLLNSRRTRRRASFCSAECARLDKIAHRGWLAKRACRRCGRPARKLRPEARAESGKCVGDGGHAQETPIQRVSAPENEQAGRAQFGRR